MSFLPFLLSPLSPSLHFDPPAREAIRCEGGRLRLVSPRATSLPLCSCRRSSPYCYCCCCRCRVGATPFFLYRALCQLLAAAVLLLCYVVAAEVLLLFRRFSP